jgi:hypothetical protein
MKKQHLEEHHLLFEFVVVSVLTAFMIIKLRPAAAGMKKEENKSYVRAPDEQIERPVSPPPSTNGSVLRELEQRNPLLHGIDR